MNDYVVFFSLDFPFYYYDNFDCYFKGKYEKSTKKELKWKQGLKSLKKKVKRTFQNITSKMEQNNKRQSTKEKNYNFDIIPTNELHPVKLNDVSMSNHNTSNVEVRLKYNHHF